MLSASDCCPMSSCERTTRYKRSSRTVSASCGESVCKKNKLKSISVGSRPQARSTSLKSAKKRCRSLLVTAGKHKQMICHIELSFFRFSLIAAPGRLHHAKRLFQPNQFSFQQGRDVIHHQRSHTIVDL